MKIAFLTDIHEDLLNLERAIHFIHQRNCQFVVCLGDISGYNTQYYNYKHRRNAHDCLQLIKKECSFIIVGNHDLHAGSKIPSVSPLFSYPENWYSLNIDQRRDLTNDSVWLYTDNESEPNYSAEDIDFLKTLKIEQIISTESYNLLLSHYVYPNITGSSKEYYLHPDEFAPHFAYMEKKKCRYAIAGHAHIDGLHIITSEHVIREDYQRIDLPDEQAIILCPSVSDAKIRNGFLIFDIQKSVIEAVQI